MGQTTESGNVRDYNIGNSNYSKHKIQPWNSCKIEYWADIEGFDYQVSNLGQVKSLDKKVRFVSKSGDECFRNMKGKILSSSKNNAGYLKVALWKDNNPKYFDIHRLVATSFVDGYFDEAVVNHLDEDRLNNKCSNLEWCTQKENVNYSKIDKEVRSYNIGSSNYSEYKIQPWSIWQEYNLNPWDADIIKRVLRTKIDDSRKLDYEKIIHICKERIRQIDDK